MNEPTKFTPGPWKTHRTHLLSSTHYYVVTNANGYGPIMEVGGHDMNGQIAEGKFLVTDPAIIEANARLIAQSPALYAALILARQAIHDAIRRPMGVEPDSATQALRAIEEVVGQVEGKEGCG